MKRWTWLVLGLNFLANPIFAMDLESTLASNFETSLGGGIVSVPLRPNSTVTPGDLCSKSNPDFDEYRYRVRLAHCARNVSSEDRAKIYDQYQIPKNCRQHYTIDHFIPLSIGGSNSPKNLWPEHKQIKLTRFHFEEEIMKKVVNGDLTQAEAVDEVREVKQNPDLSRIDTRSNDECHKFMSINFTH